MTRTNRIRRAAGALAIAVGVLAVSGSGASAASGKLPAILNGSADSLALRVTLTLPSIGQLEATLAAIAKDSGVSVPTIPAAVRDLLKEPTVIDQKISLTNGTVVRADEKLPDQAKGFAAAVLGKPDILNTNVSSSCSKATCRDRDSILAQKLDLPSDLGVIKVAGATSTTEGLVKTINNVALLKVHLNLASLIGKGKPLAAVGDALATLTSTVNSAVLPPVNSALETLNSTLSGVLPDPVEDLISKVVTHVGPIQPIPDLRTVDLLNLTVLGGKADVLPQVRGGVEGLLARSQAKVSDVDILQDPISKKSWASIDAVGMKSDAYANGVAGAAVAHSDIQVAGAELGGLLGIDVPEQTIADLLDPETIKNTLADSAPAGAEAAVDELIAAVDLLYNVAGIRPEFFKEYADWDREDGLWAKSNAGTLALTVAPRIPKLAALKNNLPTADAIVPRLGKDDYVASGIVLKISLPSGNAAVALQGDVLPKEFPKPGRTGVGTPWLVAIAMLAGAVVVRKFVLSK